MSPRPDVIESKNIPTRIQNSHYSFSGKSSSLIPTKACSHTLKFIVKLMVETFYTINKRSLGIFLKVK